MGRVSFLFLLSLGVVAIALAGPPPTKPPPPPPTKPLPPTPPCTTPPPPTMPPCTTPPPPTMPPCHEPPPPTPQCGENEVWMECGTACEPSCENPKPQMCTLQCVIGCQCRKGYLRDCNGKCVLPKDC